MRILGGLTAIFILAGASFASENPRVFVTDSQSWEIGGGVGGTSDGFGGGAKGGARPQTAEIVKTFHERCPNVIINNRRDKANYVVVLDHEGGKASLRRDNKIAIFEQSSGDAIFSRSTRSLGNSVKDGCAAIFRDWSRRSGEAVQSAPVEGSPEMKQQLGASAEVKGARVQIASTPAGADIEVDGAFVGSTPSSVNLSPGEHTIVVKKNGYDTWQRKLKILGGEVSLNAELMKQ